MISSCPIIPRDHYLKKIRAGRDAPFVKILTGIRRCGKSTLMELFKSELLASGVSENDIISINFDTDSDDIPKDHRQLTDFIVSRLVPGPGKYIFLDEVQNVREWERTVSSLYVQGADIYITGSNSDMLSSELATKLSGRAVEIEVMPLSFSEYVLFRSVKTQNLEELYSEYTTTGGLPAIAISQNEGASLLIREMIANTYQSAYIKDVIERRQIRNPAVISNLLKFLMRNVGDRTSARNASRHLTSKGQKVSNVTIEEYLAHLEEAYLVSRSRRMDLETREYLCTSDKYYATDLGIRSHLVPGRPDDIDGILENVVYNELRFRYGDVAVGSVGNKEIDFIADPNGKPSYYQVSVNITDATTRDRELSSLIAVHDNHPKTIITMDRYPAREIDGVHIMNVIDWLMEK